jgi:hypothetical protein
MLLSWPASTHAGAVGAADVRAGRRFYEAGIGAAGTGVKAVVQGDLQVPSTAMPCTNCHRRSGWGTTEGPLTTPPVVGDVLFSPLTRGTAQIGTRSTGPGTRPPYDDASLLRAIREGVDPGGRTLSPSMPRYALGDSDGASLVSYLRALGSVPPPGVTPSTLHLATITSRTADPRKREAVLGVLRAFVELKNAKLRNETRRREHAPWDMKSQYELYRDWEVHEWTVDGDPRDWPRQLAEQYARQPVFAVVSGVADGDWAPVHQFCEDNQLPCVFPQPLLPPDRGVAGGFYSLYYSPGLALESAALVEHLRASSAPGRPRLLQVARCGSPGATAAARVEALLGDRFEVTTRCMGGTTPGAEGWRQLLSTRPDIVMPWLDAGDLSGLGALVAVGDAPGRSPAVYLSASILGDDIDDLDRGLRAAAFLLEPFVPPDEFDQHAARTLVWLKSRGLTAVDRIAATNALFAVTAVADAVATPRVLTSREYLIEQIEHMVGRSPQPTAFPAVGLGALRRFASVGCSVVKMPAAPGSAFEKARPWFVPERIDTK